jgi:hypothetical protein
VAEVVLQSQWAVQKGMELFQREGQYVKDSQDIYTRINIVQKTNGIN